MIYARALEMIRNHPDVSLVYHPATASYIMVAGDKIHHIAVSEFSEMDETDFMYEVVHTIRLTHLDKANSVTQKH